MAGNTRGKLKEEFEGVHTNFEWAKKHLSRGLILIKDHNPKLSGAIKSLAKSVETLDSLALDVYSKL